jgi:membrane fusion protein, copper/silver efflux system
MNRINTASVAAMLLALAACDAQNATQGATANKAPNAQSAEASSSASHSGTGIVRGVSATAITIAHGEIKSASWPAMEMAFTLSDPALAQGVKAGDSIAFTFTITEGGNALTSLSKR